MLPKIVKMTVLFPFAMRVPAVTSLVDVTFTHIYSMIHAHTHVLVSLTQSLSLLLIYSSSSFVIHTHTHTGLISLPPFHPLVEPYNIRDNPVANDFMTL